MRVKKVQRNKKRIFGACVLFLTVVLALATAVLAANGTIMPRSSYQLTIKKVFADGTPPEAKGVTYTFRVMAQVESGGGYEPREKTVTITGDGEETIDFGAPFKVSVIEQTDDGGFKLDGADWDVSKTECLSEMHVGASTAKVNISKNDGKIEVTRPAGAPAVTFRLIGKPFHGGGETTYPVVTVNGGETKELGVNLPQGEYTITKLRSTDGFSVLVGPRDFEVPAGGQGEVHINGAQSKLLIKAPPADADGTVRTHHYEISGPESREIDLKSGEIGLVENLKEGTYTIQVSKTYEGVKDYTVTVPKTTITKRENKKSSAFSYTNDLAWKYISLPENPKPDYVQVYAFGPLYDASNKKINSKVTYQLNFAVLDENGKKARNYTAKKERQGSQIYTLDSPKLDPSVDNKLYFAVSGVSNTSAKTIGVKWREYYLSEKTETFEDPSASGSMVEVDDRGWITISKPEDPSARGDEVNYYFTITDSNDEPITGYTLTDENDNPIDVPTNEETPDGKTTTLTLKAGQTVNISGLQAGSFRIKQTIVEAPKMAFDVELEDTVKTATEPGKEISITTLGDRTVSISKLGDPADDNYRVYTYEIYQGYGSPPLGTIELKSGETKTVAEATGSMLPAGEYRITPVDDQIIGFDVAFTDSSSLTSDYVTNATVTFTNHFSRVQSSYHVIHEYYLKKNGSYTFEGASPVYTKNCNGSHDEGGGHYSKDIHQMNIYNGLEYAHFSDAYGKVVSWGHGEDEKDILSGSDSDSDSDLDYLDPDDVVNYDYGSSWTGSNGIEDDLEKIRNYSYAPLDNLDCAMAVPHTADGQHEDTAQIIILRYFREEADAKPGKYNVIHVYYRRTSSGDIWDGSREMHTEDVGPLTQDNRAITYSADDVEKLLRFTPKDDGVEYPYTYGGASYGRVVPGSADDDTSVGSGERYQTDDTMEHVYATTEGDQIIILRYYRSGGYNVVHEYYYREKADSAEDSSETEETPGDGSGGETAPEGREGLPQAEGDAFNGTLSDSDGFTYDFEGKSGTSSYSAALESWHDAGEVTKEPKFRPESQQYTYTYKDAVYGYLDKDSNVYSVAPYKTGVTANAQDDEIIILRYFRGDSSPVTPPDPTDPDVPDKPPTDPDDPPTKPENPPKDPEEPPEDPKYPPKDPENPPTDPENPPTDPENPPTDPENPPTNPEYPTELPDPNDPDSPDEITIWEDGVPKTYMKVWDPESESWIYIPEEQVPLWNKVPQTGDEGRTVLWAALAAASLCGSAALVLWSKKRKNG